MGAAQNLQPLLVPRRASQVAQWEIDGETVSDFIFLGPKITTDGDCSHEIKRRLLLGRKVTNSSKNHLNAEQLHFHFSLSRIGEGNDNPLMFLPRESHGRGAWWAAIYGVAQSRTQLM